MAASVRETTITQESPILPIEELSFFRARADLLQPQSDLIMRKRAQDRTVSLVRRYVVLTENLPMIRAQTVSCFEAVEGKNGTVSLRICNRAKFAAIKQSVADMEEEQSGLEQAIRALDEIHAGFLSEMQDTRSSLATVESQQQQLLSTHAAAALQRGARLRQSPEKILEADQIYQQKKTLVESQIATAKKGLAKLEPEIAKIEAILSGVGC